MTSNIDQSQQDDGTERSSPRALPVVRIGHTTYFVDERLNELRNVTNPHDREKMEASAQFYVDTWGKGRANGSCFHVWNPDHRTPERPGSREIQWVQQELAYARFPVKCGGCGKIARKIWKCNDTFETEDGDDFVDDDEECPTPSENP